MKPTPEQQKQGARLISERDAAEEEMHASYRAYRAAYTRHLHAKKAYQRAETALTDYREKMLGGGK